MTAPDPSPAAVFDRASATYDDVGVEFFSVFGRELVRRAGLRAGERVLDVGTGRGAVLFPALGAVGPSGHVTGIDLAEGMVARTATDLAERGVGNGRVLRGDAAEPPVEGPFDAVLSSLVVFFLDDPAAGLARWARLVGAGGRLGLVTFVQDPDDTRFRDIVGAFLDAGASGPEPEEGPSSFELVRDPVWLDGALASAGLGTVTSAVERHPTAFTDVDQWWRWAWSQGMRVALEAIPEGRHEAFKAEIAKDLAANPLPDGRLGMHVSVRYTIAER